MNEILKNLYIFLGSIAAAIIAPIWGGYVFSVLWSWFIVTTFGLPAISIAASVGVLLVVSFAAKEIDVGRINEARDRPGLNLFLVFMRPGLALLVGWIVNHWM